MTDSDEYDVSGNVGAEASETIPRQCSSLRKGQYVLIKNRPCKVVEMSTSKTGKHGHAKVHFVGLDIFTQKKLEDICPSTHTVNCPNVVRSELEVVVVDDDGFATCMDECGHCREIKIPKDIPIEKAKTTVDDANNNDEMVLAVIWKAMGTEEILDLKTTKRKDK